MLRISDQQMEAFRNAKLRAFEDDMNVHLAKFSPPLYKAVKEDQMRKVIRLGINSANNYGFNFRGPVRLYLEMMLLFGSHFDTDPQYPWAIEILNKTRAGSQMERAGNLYERVCEYRKHVNGQDDVYTLDALRAIVNFSRQPLTVTSNGFVTLMQREMLLIYPQKSNYMGNNAQWALINESIAAAKRYDISTDRGNVLTVVLMLAFGHGCFEDPLYPWINVTIHNDRIADSGFRAARLESKALTWLDHVLNNFDKDVNNELP